MEMLPLAKSAIILVEEMPTVSQARLGRILDFFGVPWETVKAADLSDTHKCADECVVFASTETLATALKDESRATASLLQRVKAAYIYAGKDRGASAEVLQILLGDKEFSLRDAAVGRVVVRVSHEVDDIVGPMAGIEASVPSQQEDSVVISANETEKSKFTSIMSAGGAPIFILFQRNGVQVFFSGSSEMVDIEQKVGSGFYDVKQHFCSAVPLIMFLRFIFREIAWHPQELSACLIVDDPLLKQRYGHCDFVKLRDFMRQYDFTTNIAFIPWNWRRTSAADADFFRSQSDYFSVSIHGCDHIGDEFGTTSFEIADGRARLAQSRMRNHEARTGIHHDLVMVFPQGVFSSVCPEALKRNGFLAAVNTETLPVDAKGSRTCIRDVWDVAIRTYGGFPIFTRRYASHGLENFAFDLLLGKPCLIVSHHGFFRDSGAELIELIEKLRSLNCCLRWRPLGDVIRRACRRRVTQEGMEEVEMYGNELLIDNSSNQGIDLLVHKRESHSDLVAEIRSDGKPVNWTTEADRVVFNEKICPHSEKRLQVVYREPAAAGNLSRSLRFELSVAVRRMLCEFRDDYLSRSPLLSTAAANLKNAVTRVN